MKVWKILYITIFILILSSLSVSAAQISEYEATKIVKSYAYEGEVCEAYGPYEYNNNMYYVCSILEGENIITEIVIDANTGDVVTSETVSNYLIKHDLALYYLFDEESYSLNIQNVDTYRQNVDTFGDYYDFWIEIHDSAAIQEQKQNAQEAADISLGIKSIYENKVEAANEIIAIQAQIKAGGSLKDAEEIVEAEEEAYYIEKQALDKLNNAIEKTPTFYSTILNSNYRYGISESEWKTYEDDDMSFFEYEKDVTQSNIAYWESMESSLEDDTQWYYEAMVDRVEETTSSNETPSFTFGISTFALLIIGIFLNGKNKK
jgi:predicted small secreted protein